MSVIFDISAHGFGHLSQTVPLIRALHARRPDVPIVVRTAVPERQVRSRLRRFPFDHVSAPTDLGVRMNSLLCVDGSATAAAYVTYHHTWIERVQDWQEQTDALQPHLVVSNVSYLSIAAAARLGVPAIGYGSLNWVDIVRGFLAAQTAGARVLQEIQAAYASASAFIELTPGMPCPWVERRTRVHPVCDQGIERREYLRSALGVSEAERLVLLAFGGHQTDVLRSVRVPDGYRYVSGQSAGDGVQLLPREVSRFPFLDVLASVDILITKPGYSTIVEAARTGVPTVFVRRQGWAEEPYLIGWLLARRAGVETSIERLCDGSVLAELEQALSLPRNDTAMYSGTEQAVRIIEEYLPG